MWNEEQVWNEGQKVWNEGKCGMRDKCGMSEG